MTPLARSAYAHLARRILTTGSDPAPGARPAEGPTAAPRRRHSTAIPSCRRRAKRANRDNLVGDCADFAITAQKFNSSRCRRPFDDPSGLAPRLSGLTWPQRARLTRGWRLEALDHHASIEACARVVLQLLAVGAPDQLVAAAQGAGSDEIDHTERCLAMASAYADRPISLNAHDSCDALHSCTDPLAIAIHTVRAGCVGDTLHAALAAAAAQEAVDPAVRRLFVRIAADETRHAGLAWRYLKWTLDRLQSASLTDTTAALFESQLARIEARPSGPAGRDDRWLAQQGILTAAAQGPIAIRTMHEVVMPCARALLAEVGQPTPGGYAADVA
jgi:hypothetical protein